MCPAQPYRAGRVRLNFVKACQDTIDKDYVKLRTAFRFTVVVAALAHAARLDEKKVTFW